MHYGIFISPAAVPIHPDQKDDIPLAIEPIVKLDGETKSDCERNATKRLFARIKQQHPDGQNLRTWLAKNHRHVEIPIKRA